MKNSQNQIKTFWKIPDAQQEKLLSLVETEQKELSDTLQSVLDQFGNTEMKGYLPRQKIERLYLAIRRWEQDGYDEGEMRLWMNDLKTVVEYVARKPFSCFFSPQWWTITVQ